MADAKGIVPQEQGPVGGEQWSEWLYFQGLEINCKIVHQILSQEEVCAKGVTFLPLLCTCTSRTIFRRLLIAEVTACTYFFIA